MPANLELQVYEKLQYGHKGLLTFFFGFSNKVHNDGLETM